MVFFACSHIIDATTVDIYTRNFDREDLEDGYEDGLSHTMEFFHMLENDSPPLSTIVTEPISVQGRLREYSPFWVQGLEASQFVLDIVRTGYRLPFITFPPPLEADNHQSALEHATFVEESMVILSRLVVYKNLCPLLQCVAPFRWCLMPRVN